MAKLYKKEEESLISKKKKREELKQKTKSEKSKINKNTNGIKQYNNNYMGVYMNQIPPMNNPPQGYIDGYPNLYYYNGINSSYTFPTQMIGYNPYFHQYYMDQPKNLEESINFTYNRGIVNNIIGAFFIKECQEKFKNNEKRKVPVAMVELDEEHTNKTENNGDNMFKNEKKDENVKESANEMKNDENEKGEDMNKLNNNNGDETKEKKELRKPDFIN